jgi:hypothetical protein
VSILTRLVALVTFAALTACGSGPVATAGGSATATGDPSRPAGVIALGHSGLTGEGTAELGEAGFENSWATGINPTVNSVYLRLVEIRPENADKVANAAVGGSPASQLVRQAESALHQVPYPQLAIVQTIDSDIRCDGTDDEHVPEFGQALTDALHVIVSASPNTKILVVGQLGRPNVEFVKALVKLEPDQKDNLTGSGPCDFFDPSGKLVPQSFETLRGIIDAYEAEQARVCGQVPNCMTDGGVRADYVDVIENFSSDFNHLNVAGQAAEAELIWPVVQDLLGL